MKDKIDNNLNVEFYTEPTSDIVPDIYTMVKLMEDDNEPKRVVFTMTYFLMINKVSTFFIVKEGEDKIAFGLFVYGVHDKNFRRLKYFTVKRNKRGQGLGVNSLQKAIEKEINLDSGCNVACNHDLENFYSKLGFVKSNAIQKAHENFANNNYITMNLCSNKCDPDGDREYGDFYDIGLEEPAAFITYKKLEETYRIKLMPKGMRL
ncbi:MAG: hypothetical protein COB67_00405 [SAR324 cluster bacterium]|uniref:N-acetyltransferase domain-containing protein n=1 Tax=SAR324 cluster bacterium TaxID=2024889 RepID=A0A2A4TBG0_9DELT|nr:MAG: hypothetical protein COB67_00405 [SAR324 cluster bacterium]